MSNDPDGETRPGRRKLGFAGSVKVLRDPGLLAWLKSLPKGTKLRIKSPSRSPQPNRPPEHEPHWAVSLLDDPRAPFPQLQEGKDYNPNIDPGKAVGLFDPSQPGHVPPWFPKFYLDRKNDRLITLTLQQRAEWMDQALEWFAPREETWPPSGDISHQKRVVAQSFCRMLSALEQDPGNLPTPDL